MFLSGDLESILAWNDYDFQALKILDNSRACRPQFGFLTSTNTGFGGRMIKLWLSGKPRLPRNCGSGILALTAQRSENA